MTESHELEAELRAALGEAYEIERQLTGSGMSRVFVANERALNRRVVIKVLPPDVAAGVNRERFRREIQLAAQLQHPHIVPLHTAGARGDLLYFTMPYIEGESLRHAIQHGVRFSVREVVRILHDVSDALAYAHARGVVHRDIKPGNVLRSGSHAMVTDFGVAKAISVSMPAVTTTSSGMAIGTPAYMAPEQLAGDPSADHRVDIYALGLLAYELLTGDAPFKAASPQETMAAQLTRAPEPVSRRRGDVPPALASIIESCLAKNAGDRPQSAAEVAAVLGDLDVSSGSMPPLRPAAHRGRQLAAAAALVLAAGALALWRRGGDEPDTIRPVLTAVGDTPTSTPITHQLTRDDSLAIARAVQKKVNEQQAVARAKAESTRKTQPSATPDTKTAIAAAEFATQLARIADSLRSAIQKAVLDSVARQRGLPPGQFQGVYVTIDSSGRGLRGGSALLPPRAPDVGRRELRSSALSAEAFAARRANMGPPRRLLVSYPQLTASRLSYAPASDSLVDSLRRAISRGGRFLVIDADSTRQVLARTRSVDDVARIMNVELFASVLLGLVPDGSVIWQVTLRDLSAHTSFATRTFAHRAPRDSVLVRTDSLIVRVLRQLEEMDRAPRRASREDRGG
jgi:serine/threonine-protein kinase